MRENIYALHQNYYFLRQLSPVLLEKISDLQLMACWSQEKDELILGFAAARGKHKNYKEVFLKVVLQPAFACLFLTDTFERAKKNSVDLFDDLLDKKVLGVRQFLNERSFAIVFEDDYTLVFKLFGNRSNLVLFQGTEVLDIFHNKLVEDNRLDISSLDRPLDQRFENFCQHEGNSVKIFPTFGKIAQQVIKEFQTDDLVKKWAYIQNIKTQLEKPNYYLVRWQYELHLSLLPVGEILKTFDNPLDALHAFYIAFTQVDALTTEKAVALRHLQRIKKQTEAYIQTSFEETERKEKNTKNEYIGHILMANLHQIPEQVKEVELFDFYQERNIKISLKSDLSPQKNAENYYRKAKNEQIEEQKRFENITLRENLLAKINQQIADIETSENLRALRAYIKSSAIFGITKNQDISEQFKKYEHEGFEIWVGRNAKNNDLLTKSAFKEDLWLHARNVQGSHVIVKYRAGKKYPNSVIERAAELAAWHSKRKTDSLTPVIVTPKKYVRKPKGLPDGSVVLDKEEVVMVQPRA